MSQYLDMLASNSVGTTSSVDTSALGWNSDSNILRGNLQTPLVKTGDNTMLYLTGAGVLIAALALYRSK